MTIIKQLIGHTSEDTAYVVDDYPYGFTTRTSIRYWVETKAKLGQRFVSQTLNPKTGKWNKPKASTYSPVLVIGLNEKEHVVCSGLKYYAEDAAWEKFSATFELDDFQKAEVKKVLSFHAKFNAKFNAKKEALTAEGKAAGYADVIKACIEDDIATVKAGGVLV